MAVLIAAESEKNTLLQVNTGEGKTLLIATLAILRAKQNKTVDVITSSPVLAARDVEKMKPLFNHFRITASHNCEEQLDPRKLAYKSDRKRECVIVDEVDNMLLDNGNNMLYLSHNVAGMETLVSLFVFLHRTINVPLHDVFIENTKRAMFMRHNDEYVVDVDHKNASSDLNPRVTIIDKNTGVDLTTSQWSEGLHQTIQLKHGCRLSPISLKAIFVSNVGFFKGYERINGLSGTLGSVEESKSLVALYDADLVRIPTWKPKNFYEHVPLVAANEALWLQNIYEEVKDQVIARRSVLIICNSISQVDVVQRGLERLHRLEKQALPGKNCFDNLIVYRRDHDEFDLSGAKALPNCRIIIATNLAGRGTDIELSEGLQQAGGLHVIVAFLPENCRIEEQAFGRAARCGHPGSGQIIALIENDRRIDASETPTIFQLKAFHEWALWLDEQAPLIQQCAKNCSEDDKHIIIESVQQFLTSHPFNNIETAMKWIKCPQPLLTLGLIELNQNNINRAQSIFHRVIKHFPEYAAEAYYYIGVIQQRITRQVHGKLSFSKAFDPDTWKQWLIGTQEREIVAAINAFHESRQRFSLRRLHRGELAAIVARLQHANESIISTNGFADQHQ
ncbi:unnamed protein product, partial [Rotaria sordida]